MMIVSLIFGIATFCLCGAIVLGTPPTGLAVTDPQETRMRYSWLIPAMAMLTRPASGRREPNAATAHPSRPSRDL
jgi:hypothetical protein